MDYVISAETRDQLIDLLEDVANDKGGYPLNRSAANILPHLKAAPVLTPTGPMVTPAGLLEAAMDAIVDEAMSVPSHNHREGIVVADCLACPEQADPITAAKAEADRVQA